MKTHSPKTHCPKTHSPNPGPHTKPRGRETNALEQDPIHRRLREFQVESPPAVLRTRTFAAVDAELTRSSRRRSDEGGRLSVFASARWTTELAFAAAILVCWAALPSYDEDDHRTFAPHAASAAADADFHAEQMARQIDADRDLAENLRLRESFQRGITLEPSTIRRRALP